MNVHVEMAEAGEVGRKEVEAMKAGESIAAGKIEWVGRSVCSGRSRRGAARSCGKRDVLRGVI